MASIAWSLPNVGPSDFASSSVALVNARRAASVSYGLACARALARGVKRAISCVLPADESALGAHSDTAALRIAAGEQRGPVMP